MCCNLHSVFISDWSMCQSFCAIPVVWTKHWAEGNLELACEEFCLRDSDCRLDERVWGLAILLWRYVVLTWAPPSPQTILADELDWIGNCLIQYMIAIHKDCHLKIQNSSWDPEGAPCIKNQELRAFALYSRNPYIQGLYIYIIYINM